jgi:hypothetical protein
MMTTNLKIGELGNEAGSLLFFSPVKSSKFQVPSSKEAPNSNTLKLSFDVLSVLGIWNLESGTFSFAHG